MTFRQFVLFCLFMVALAAAGIAALLVLASVSDNSQSAKEQVTTVKRDVQSKAPKAALAKTDKKATTAKKATDKVARKVDRQVIKLDRTITVLGKAGVNGLPGKNGRPGAPGRDAVVPFTLADVVAGLSPKLVSVVQDKLPTPAQVVDACGGACVGASGRDGRDGQDVTPQMVDDAVARFCAAHGDCRGPQGAPGADSVTPGPAGPPGADSTVQGPPGPQGPPGVSPTTFACGPANADGTFTCTAVG